MQKKIFLMLVLSMTFIAFAATASAQQRFIAHLNSPQEVPPNNSTATGVCDIVLNSTETQFTVTCTYRGLTSAVVMAHIHTNGPVGVNSPVRFNFAFTGGTSGTIGPLTFSPTPAEVANLRAKGWYANIHTSNFMGGEIRGQVKITNTVFDLDGDSRTDITVFRQSANAFYTLSSLTNSLIFNTFGSGAGDNWLNSTSDFDGDGRSDPLLLKIVGGVANWSVLQSGTNSIRTTQWGNFPPAPAVADSLAPGDYDGDGREDIAVFRRTNGFWYIIDSSTNTARVVQNFGAVNDFPSVGDFDKDGRIDLTVVRIEGGQWIWYTQLSSTGQSVRVPWGATATDSFFLFAKVDIDGDGRQDRLVFRNPTAAVGEQATFFILRSSDNQPFVLPWGLDSDTRLLGDYDGDGKTDIVARRNVGGQLVWYIYQSSNGQGRAVTWGIMGDQ